jgi:hypothetical protein
MLDEPCDLKHGAIAPDISFGFRGGKGCINPLEQPYMVAFSQSQIVCPAGNIRRFNFRMIRANLAKVAPAPPYGDTDFVCIMVGRGVIPRF